MSERAVPATAAPLPHIEDADGHNLVIRELEALVEALVGLSRLAAGASDAEVRRRALELRQSFDRRVLEMASWMRGLIEQSGTAMIAKAMGHGASRLRTK